ncbi:RNA polymerase sigma factor [Paenibacillus sp. PAMC21692]|nr:RNA polymerase sigma factor [Paenibacillus sp. PAMC21692]
MRVKQEIISRVIQGDRDAFRSLYDEYFDYAMRTAMLVTKHGERAKDAVQETFLRVYRNIWQYDSSKPFKPWLYCILLRECYRVMEREKKVVPLAGELELERIGVEPELPDTSLDVYDALQSLPDMYRIPLILKYLHDYSEKEIADTLELNVNTLKSRLLKGREKMRDRLGGEPHGSKA